MLLYWYVLVHVVWGSHATLIVNHRLLLLRHVADYGSCLSGVSWEVIDVNDIKEEVDESKPLQLSAAATEPGNKP